MLPPIVPDHRLSIEAIAALMPAYTRSRFDLRVVESTGSTNADLMHDAASLPSGTVLATDCQTAGRGRRGRTWIAPAAGSLAFSVLWKFGGEVAALSGLSLAVGVAVARALEHCGAAGVALKWPNDLLAPQEGGWAKLGGILIELAAAGGGPAPSDDAVDAANQVSAVIGIGLNLDLGAAAAGIDQPVTDLRSIGCAASRNALLAAQLHQLGEVLPAFAASGFAPFHAEWNQRHAWRGLRVQLLDSVAGATSGTALDAAPDGALLVETTTGLRRIVSGDVSLRRASLSQS